jgi:ApaG protein
MVDTQTTHGIKISVEASFQEEYSKPLDDRYIFAYRITIENTTKVSVQLLERHWFIFDSCGTNREVEGEGVIGQQPIIEPGQSFQYTSWCDLTTDMGSMRGYYSMRQIVDSPRTKPIQILIPEFNLIPAYRQS